MINGLVSIVIPLFQSILMTCILIVLMIYILETRFGSKFAQKDTYIFNKQGQSAHNQIASSAEEEEKPEEYIEELFVSGESHSSQDLETPQEEGYIVPIQEESLDVLQKIKTTPEPHIIDLQEWTEDEADIIEPIMEKNIKEKESSAISLEEEEEYRRLFSDEKN